MNNNGIPRALSWRWGGGGGGGVNILEFPKASGMKIFNATHGGVRIFSGITNTDGKETIASEHL